MIAVLLVFIGICIGAILTASLLFFTDRMEEIADLNEPEEEIETETGV